MSATNKEHQAASSVKVGETLGSRLRSAREEAGISMRELSRRSGVSVAHLSRLERDLQDPTVGMLRTIADALGIELVDLVIDPETSLRHRVIADTVELTRPELRQVAGAIAGLVDDRARALAARPRSTRIFQDIHEGAEVAKATKTSGDDASGKTTKTRRTRRRRRS